MTSFRVSYESKKNQAVDLPFLRELVTDISSLGKRGIQVIELVCNQQGKNSFELEKLTGGRPCSKTIRKYCDLAVQKNILCFTEYEEKVPGRYGGRRYSPRLEIISTLWMAVRLLKEYLNSRQSIDEILHEIDNDIAGLCNRDSKRVQEIQKPSPLVSLCTAPEIIEQHLHNSLRQKFPDFTDKYRDVAVLVFMREVCEGQQGVRVSEPRDSLDLSDSWINMVMRRLVKAGLLRRESVANYHLYFVTEKFLKTLPPAHTDIPAYIVSKEQQPASQKADFTEQVSWVDELKQPIMQGQNSLVKNHEQGPECVALMCLPQNCFPHVCPQPKNEQPTFEEIIEHLYDCLEQSASECASLREALKKQREETDRLRVRVQSDSDRHTAERYALQQSSRAEIANLQLTIQSLGDDQRQKYAAALDAYRRSQALAKKR